MRTSLYIYINDGSVLLLLLSLSLSLSACIANLPAAGCSRGYCFFFFSIFCFKGEQRRSMWSMIKEGYEGLVMTVIRPLRAQYTIEDLGPKHALINDVVTHRIDLQLKNEGGYTLECSWWKPKTTEKECVCVCARS